MKIFGIAGWSGSGKTTLLVRLLPALTGRGLTVSTVKHAHMHFDMDRPGKDSYRHREAGARETLVISPKRWALLHESQGEEEATLEQLLPKLAPVDLLLIEGFKHHAHDKLEVHRAVVGKPLLAPNDPRIVGIASDGAVPGAKVPVLPLDDAAAIADFVLARAGLSARP
ncbi:MAG: molybdopterin-guanine dinucleotide biosynthesis protein B [Alphaproteobacteria bacterium]|nr:molybdopterin-guanine dinucleotide biosynthesis protein B [Alphaproteobacteria bacterium]